MEKMDDMKLIKTPIAHRGLWNKQYPENSMGAFTNAAKNGYPIELDVQLTKDNEVIVFHDDNMERMTGVKGCAVFKPYSQVKELKLNHTDYIVPHFKDVLDEINGKVPLLIEIKNTRKNTILCDNLIKLLLKYKGEFAVQSFNPYILKYFVDKYPVIKRGILSTFDYGKEISKIKAFILKRMMFNYSIKPNFISYDYRYLPNKYIDKCKEQEMAILAWTLKSQKEYDKIKDYVDNIIFEGFIPE